MARRSRLDLVLLERGLAESRNAARGLIMAGRVRVDGRLVDKAGAPTAPDAAIEVASPPPYVSRAGEKLAHALDVFSLDVTGTHALDVGASTGGFTDCLLQRGAARVIALDVGYGQLDQRLRQDPRVHVIERLNARYLRPEDLPYPPDLVTGDVSFISLRKVLPAVFAAAADRFRAVLLVKPQFEAGRDRVGKGGIVRDAGVHVQVLRELVAFLREDLGMAVQDVAESGLPGTGGNREFFLLCGRGGGAGASPATLERSIRRVTGVDPDE